MAGCLSGGSAAFQRGLARLSTADARRPGAGPCAGVSQPTVCGASMSPGGRWNSGANDGTRLLRQTEASKVSFGAPSPPRDDVPQAGSQGSLIGHSKNENSPSDRVELLSRGRLGPLPHLWGASHAFAHVMGSWVARRNVRQVRHVGEKISRCGARARSRGGEPCQAPPVLHPETGLPRNGRCKLHGGRSTGPRTIEGRRRVAEAQRRRGNIEALGQQPKAQPASARSTPAAPLGTSAS
jgi:hypothetical protein